MDIAGLLVAQLTDPFRVGLIVFLLVTARNNAAATGYALPLLLGIIFVAILLPVTVSREAPDLFIQIGVGILSNAILLGAALGLYALWRRVTARR